ncbi:diguanylate cyclase domain-containing protein [Oceanisphaera pacifica]|uniref:Diguanylate cyclase n=1 Tax=Oceanisphaera pacifica TaxID=2818389 RepID=A0ABS3NG33_9GAMM|nr:diguanylate cyclase [Oceanisphaera pacifica]MBO1519500.1 diguanylate cyclase [Oceanisphaera pacifica]
MTQCPARQSVLPELSQKALDEIENGIILLDKQQNVLFWNKWLERYSGVSAQLALGKRLELLFDQALPEVLLTAVEEACEQRLSRLLSHQLHPKLLPLLNRHAPVHQTAIHHSITLRSLRHKEVVLVHINNITTAIHRERHLRDKEQALRKVHQAQSAEKKFIDTILETMSALVVVTDPSGCIVNLNHSVELHTGFTQQQLQGQPFKMLLGLDGLKYLPSAEQSATKFSVFTCRMSNAHGDPLHIRWTVKQVKEEGQPTRYLIYTGQDITVQDRADALLRLEREMLEMATSNESAERIFDHTCLSLERQLESCRVAVVKISAEQHLQVCNGPSLPDSFCQQLYALQTDRLLKTLKAKLELGGLQAFSAESKGEHWHEWQALAKQYKMLGCWLMPIQVNPQISQSFLAIFPRYQSIPNDHEQMVVERIGHLAALILDRQQQQEQIAHLALYDSLTGLANRSLLNEQLVRSIHRAQREPQHFALLFIDLDGFKAINDTHGHNAGDAFLRELGLRLQQRFRSTDCCARIGGDEFVILLEEISDETAAFKVAQSLLTLIAQPIEWGDYQLQVGASIGVVLYPEDGDSAATLLTRADNAMYQAKAKSRTINDGKGQVVRLTD